MSALKELIKQKGPRSLEGVCPPDLRLWQVSIPEENDEGRRNFVPEDSKKLFSTWNVSDYFQDHPSSRNIHIIIKGREERSRKEGKRKRREKKEKKGKEKERKGKGKKKKPRKKKKRKLVQIPRERLDWTQKRAFLGNFTRDTGGRAMQFGN